jgi:hypothetical protein
VTQIRLNGLLHSEDNSAFKVIYPFSLLHLNTVQILQYDGVMMYLFDCDDNKKKCIVDI